MIPNNKNNQKQMQDGIACGCYTYIFTSFEIAILQKFKKHVLAWP